jgi:hypothetical protein
MKQMSWGIALACAALCATEPLQAQYPGMPMPNQQRMIRIGFGGGMSVPLSNARDALKTGINGQGYLLLGGFRLPIRLNLGYAKFNVKDALLNTPGAADETTILSGIGGFMFRPIRQGAFQPYITAGVGAFHIRDMFEGAASDSTESATRFGIDGGAGLSIQIGRLEAFLEGRLQNVYTETGWIDTKSIKAIPITFGVLF